MGQDMKGAVREQKVASLSVFEQMFEEIEATGKVSFEVPDPNEEGDLALLNWLKSGATAE